MAPACGGRPGAPAVRGRRRTSPATRARGRPSDGTWRRPRPRRSRRRPARATRPRGPGQDAGSAGAAIGTPDAHGTVWTGRTVSRRSRRPGPSSSGTSMRSTPGLPQHLDLSATLPPLVDSDDPPSGDRVVRWSGPRTRHRPRDASHADRRRQVAAGGPDDDERRASGAARSRDGGRAGRVRILAQPIPPDGAGVYFYELHEGDEDIFSDVLLARDDEMDAEEFFELVQSVRRRSRTITRTIR